MSILWRASQASLPPFGAVQLPDEFADILRKPIKAGGLIGPDVYLPDLLQVGVSRWKMENIETRSVITSFMPFSYDGCGGYMFLVGGLAVIYLISNKPFAPLPRGFSLVKKSFSFRMNTLWPGQSEYLDKILIAAQKSAHQNPAFGAYKLS